MKYVTPIFSYIATCCLLLLTFYFSFAAFAFNPGFFAMEFQKYDANQNVNMEMDALMRVTNHMIHYLDGKEKDLAIIEQIDGVEREFFNSKEKYHMEDVKNLFANGKIVRNAAFCGLALSILLLMITKQAKGWSLLKALRNTSMIFCSLIVILALLAATSFTKYFTIFHELFFSNDLWLLDPATDLLIRILPESFFIDIAAGIAGTFVAFLLLFMLVPAVLLRRKNKENRKR